MKFFARPVAAAVVGLCALWLFAGPAYAQSVQQKAVGTWTLVSIKVGDAEPYGPNPHGIMFLDAGGRYAVSIVRDGVPKFASNNRTKGTDAENAAAVHGALNYFGSYTISEAESSISVKMEASSYPNFGGETQKRLLAFSGDELMVTNPAPSGGGGAAKQIWKRAK
jgi:hypothetical protein